MASKKKIFDKIIQGQADRNIDFDDLCDILESLTFGLRIKGSHHIFFKEGIEEIINIQPDGNKAKAYQVKQVRNIILKYKLSIE
ncbi:MAG TPA: type II toxin-antitoxin system HicA family toxin [Chitinophagales bacterium]|nr:type II toxin-antitoxin system HicA family toxin [Chitinophagales bacterium]